jgi:putative phosphoesterase
MKRIAVVYDIHGNLPALESISEKLRHPDIEAIVFGGDMVPGPMARECLDFLHSLGKPVHPIYGNCEVMLLKVIRGQGDEVPEGIRTVMTWIGSDLRQDQKEEIASWPKTLTLPIDGLGNVLFCHGTPRDEDEIFTRRTPEELLIPILTGLGADVVVCGHTHMQFDRTVGDVRVVNAGSVCGPFGHTGADWLILGPGVEHQHEDYDREAAAATLRATDYPMRENFVSQYVLTSPSEADIFEMIAPKELGSPVSKA